MSLEDAQRAPLLFAEAWGEGRVLVDRNRLWPRLHTAAQPKVEWAAARACYRVNREFSEVFAGWAKWMSDRRALLETTLKQRLVDTQKHLQALESAVAAFPNDFGEFSSSSKRGSAIPRNK